MSTTEVKSHKVAHHFENAEQEVAASKLGIWLFLCTEILMFGGLFVGYTIYKRMYPDIFLPRFDFFGLETRGFKYSSFTCEFPYYGS